MKKIKRYFAEMLGSAVYIIIGCGSAMAVKTDYKNGSGYLAVALAFGLVTVGLYYGISELSGCHLNPAVSFANWIAGKLKFSDFLFYALFQALGAALGCGILLAVFWEHTANFYANIYYDANVYITLLIEAILSFIFILTFLIAKNRNERTAGVVIGVMMTAIQIIGIQLTRASLNPWRSLFCAVFAGGSYIDEMPVFVISPFVGALAAAGVYICFYGRSKKKNSDAPEEQNDDKNSEDATGKETENDNGNACL